MKSQFSDTYTISPRKCQQPPIGSDLHRSVQHGADRFTRMVYVNKLVTHKKYRDCNAFNRMHWPLWSVRNSTLLSPPPQRESTQHTPCADFVSFTAKSAFHSHPTVLSYTNCNLLSQLLFISSVDNCSEASSLSKRRFPFGRVAQWIRRWFSELQIAGSIPVRSNQQDFTRRAESSLYTWVGCWLSIMYTACAIWYRPLSLSLSLKEGKE